MLVILLVIYGLFTGSEEQPPNYSPKTVERIRTTFLEFQFPAQYSNHRAFSKAAFEFRQPGYGIGFDGSLMDEHDNKYQIAEIDVPNGSEEMVIVYRCGKTLEDPLDYFSHFIIEHKEEDEYIRPRRTIEINESSIRFLSNGQVYKSHDVKTLETDKGPDNNPIDRSGGSAAS